METDIRKEGQISKIREVVKTRNRERNPGRGPPAKKRKVTKGETSELEMEDHQEDENDIRNLLKPSAKLKTMAEDQQVEEEKIEEEKSIYYGETETVELVDWEERFKKHLEETREIERQREARIENMEKQEKSWELLRECMAYLKENEKTWKMRKRKEWQKGE